MSQLQNEILRIVNSRWACASRIAGELSIVVADPQVSAAANELVASGMLKMRLDRGIRPMYRRER